MVARAFPVGTNLGGMIAPWVDDAQPWLIEVRPDGAKRTFCYADLKRHAAGVARALQARRLPHGARIGIIGLNSAEYLLTYYGIMQAGYCPVPIGHKLAQDTVGHVLRDARIVLAYADAAWRTHLRDQVDVLPLDAPQDWLAHLDAGAFDIASTAARDTATILYTSGSTGVPKGVPLTHGGYLWTLRQMAVNGGAFIREQAARLLAAAPLSHMNALFSAKLATAYGGTLVLMTQFDARAFLRTAARLHCQIVTAVPTMLALCARETDTRAQVDLHAVQRVSVGSAPLTLALYEQIAAMFPNATIANGWGTTETGPAVFGPHPQGLPRPALSIGYPLPDVQVRHPRTDGAPDTGELYVRNGAIMPGYLNRASETHQRLRDGWYRTGDVMRRDADGFYYLIGRADDMFVCGGENIYPGEVEQLLERHPDVAQAAVVAVPDEIKGRIPAAFIVRTPGSRIREDDVKAFALAHGPAYQHPRFVRFIDTMPLSAANKIDKKRIQDMAGDLRR